MSELKVMEAALNRLIQQNASFFSEILSLEKEVDFFYICDLETHEIYFLDNVNMAKLPACWQNYAGRKCYELLQGRQSPCPYCNNDSLEQERYLVWQHFNPVLKRQMLLRDRLVNWHGRLVRMEVALDITDVARARGSLLDNVQQQESLLYLLRLLADADSYSDAFALMLPALCDYFDADASFIHGLTQTEMMRTHVRRGLDEPLLFVMTAHKPLDHWRELLFGREQVLIREPVQEELADSGMHSMCLTPIYAQDKLIGMLGLYNLRRHFEASFMMKTLSAVLAAAIQKKSLQEEVLHAQFVDPVTGRLNFEGYKQEVEKILFDCPQRKYALWYCDLKKFKFINDVYGYDVGDRLLRYWSDYLAAKCREGETFGRISGDNFSSLFRFEDVAELYAHFDEVVGHLAEFPELAQKKFRVDLVSGIYLIERPEDILGIGEMLNKANMAQKSVKGQSGSHLAIYNDEMRHREIREIELTAEMREAMRNEEFVLYLQPQVELRNPDGLWRRAEVLVRWQQAENRLIMPGAFIGLFEQNGMIVELDYYMMEHACRYAAQLRSQREEPVCLSVNVSRITMLQPGFVEDYVAMKERYQLPPHSIELEFTESVAVQDADYFAQLITRLREAGFLCAMDDFGTGQSSLNILQRLPLDVLKLDRQFFDGTHNLKRNRIVVSCVLAMAKALDMQTVAEGIEQEAQIAVLKEMGCDFIQGYVYSRPLSAEDFSRQLAAKQG